MGKRKCPLCGEFFADSEEQIPYKSNRYVHRRCFSAAIGISTKEKEEKLSSKSSNKSTKKKITELKEGLSEEEYKKKQELFNYIRSLIQGEIPVKTYVQIKDYHDKYRLDYSDMQKALYWFYDLEENPIRGNDVAGIIPRVIDQAISYFKRVEVVNDINSKKLKQGLFKSKVVKIIPKKEVNKKKLINIEDL